ncbi:MAG TPA: OB-fold domain-containing protein [Actinomycetota bacterium]
MTERLEGAMPVRFRYTPGLGNGAFLSALAERGVFVGSRCAACEVTYLPARSFCERCLAALVPDTECGPEGTVESWTVAHRDVDDEPIDPPITWGLVRLDGADTVLLHRLLAPAEIGARVRPVVRADRVSSIHDLEGFEPA